MEILATYIRKLLAFFELLCFFIFELKKIKKAKVVFFFPFYHTGGAEKVHLNIVKALGDSKKYVLFTQQSNSFNHKISFNNESDNYEIYDFLYRNYFIRNLFIKQLTKSINNSKTIVTVFGSNTLFFYEILPYLNTKIKKIDLIHAFSKPDYGIELSSLPYVSYLDKRVVINEKTFLDFKELYDQNNLGNYLKNIVKIENGIFIELKERKAFPVKFTVLFAGRWSKEKRPQLFLEIAKEVLKMKVDINFVMVGSDMKPYQKQIEEAGIEYKGEVFEEEFLNEIYQLSNFLLITSYREGFPVVVMEAMAQGVVPIVTNVGGLGEHISDNVNGFLIENEHDELALINKFAIQIVALYRDKSKWITISNNAIAYARTHFNIHNFNTSYKSLLLKIKV